MVVRLWAGQFVGKTAVGHVHHREDALFRQKVQNPVDGGPAQRGRDAVYVVVDSFGRDMVTEFTDGVEDELALGSYPVAGFA